MNFKKFLHSRVFYAAVCVLIITGILLSFILPGVEMRPAHIDNPLANQEIADITVLSAGEGIDDVQAVISPDGTADKQPAAQTENTDEENEDALQPEEEPEEEPEEQPEEEDQEENDEEDPQEPEEQPEEEPEETNPDETDPDDTSEGDGDQGKEDGNYGDDGGEEEENEISLVMTWYKYGNQPKTIVCAPSAVVAKNISTAQLTNGELT